MSGHPHHDGSGPDGDDGFTMDPEIVPATMTTGRPASRRLRLVCILFALAVPLAWAAIAFVGIASDGTLVVASSSLRSDPHWSDTGGVPIRDIYGHTELASWLETARSNDTQLRIVAVDGRDLADWADDPQPAARVGETREYQVALDGDTRPDPVTVAVHLRPYPFLAALADNPGSLVLWIGLAIAGSFVFWRRPRDPSARTLLALAVFVPVGMTAFPLGLQAIDLAGGRGLWPYVVGEVANALAWGAMLFFACVFPEPPTALRRRQWLAVVPFAFPFVLYALWALVWVPSRSAGLPRDEALVLISAPSAVLVLPVIAGLLIVRARRTENREHRLAIRVVLTSVILALLLFVLLGAVVDLVNGVPAIAFELQPLALAIPLCGIVAAVLRYRLYEVDLIIRRSLLALVAAFVLAGVFVALARLLQDHLPNSGLAPIVAGGLLAVLLIPLARLLGHLLSRVVLGARDDAYRVVSELRDVDPSTSLEATLTKALETLARNLRLSYAAVEVDGSEHAESVSVAIGAEHRRPTVVEIQSSGGRPWGRLVLGVAAGREPFGPRDARLLQDVGGQIGTLVESLVMNQALRQSRVRIVTAREKERSRLHRDLHDGLGPELAMSSMQLDQARRLLLKDPDRVDPLLARLAAETRNHIDEVRRIVDDLRPQALDQFGLVTALRERASAWSGEPAAAPAAGLEDGQYRRFDGGGDGSGPAMRFQVDAGDIGGLPPAVEVAAYRIVLEAVNNAAKYSGAAECRVTLSREGNQLRVVVADDGHGLPASRADGVGLASMAERAEELGGTLAVTSTEGRGTQVTALLPLDGT
jgi:two-component system NarL family sensor kinase